MLLGSWVAQSSFIRTTTSSNLKFGWNGRKRANSANIRSSFDGNVRADLDGTHQNWCDYFTDSARRDRWLSKVKRFQCISNAYLDRYIDQRRIGQNRSKTVNARSKQIGSYIIAAPACDERQCESAGFKLIFLCNTHTHSNICPALRRQLWAF